MVRQFWWVFGIWVSILLIFYAIFHVKVEGAQFSLVEGELRIYGDYQHHFFVNGTVNDIPVKFMVDTGATTTSVPLAIAEKAQLTEIGMTRVQTASGENTVKIARVDTLTIGNLEASNVRVLINPSMEHGLLGMNILKHYEVALEDNLLIIREKD